MSDAPWTYGCEPIPLSARMSEYGAPVTASEEPAPCCNLCLTLRALLPCWSMHAARERLTSKLK